MVEGSSEGSIDLVYNEIRDLLSRQESSLAAARTRAGSILAVVSLVLSFFGGAILDSSDEVSVWFWVGVGITVLGLLLALTVLAPRKETWLFSPNPDLLLSSYLGRSIGDSKVYLATYMASWAKENKEKITSMYSTLMWSVILGGIGLLVLLTVLAFGSA